MRLGVTLKGKPTRDTITISSETAINLFFAARMYLALLNAIQQLHERVFLGGQALEKMRSAVEDIERQLRDIGVVVKEGE